ncbi:hypothetical protein [Nannocystis sp.]|uniref:hypothetical protein n=1 Tax=Nannocystis sp. TaxID=1962667 RepID=UPI0025FD91E9|nr:hypothetical protein [Nannocystis sp.]MBK7829922.1 hypothetical protein [Nannocystis sp.]
MPAIALRSVLVAVVLALSACPKPGPPPTGVAVAPTATPATVATPDATCLLGDFRVQIQQRMIQDDGVTALLEDQRIGDTAVLFTAQRDAIANHHPTAPGARPQVPSPPQTLLVARGSMVTQELEDLAYVPNGGAKPTATTTRREQYTFFLADAAWDCSGLADRIAALKLPAGQASAAACLSDDLRASCQPVKLGA